MVSIAPFLLGRSFDPETVSLMTRTLDTVCSELGLKLRGPAAEVVAIKIVELVQCGVKTPKALYLRTMAAFKLDDER